MLILVSLDYNGTPPSSPCKMVDHEKQIAQYLSLFDQKPGLLAQELRLSMKKETRPMYELVADSTISLNIGYGFTKRAWDCYCAIIVYSKHINLSFPSGASLSDPDRLLQGKGKRVRHIKVRSLDEVKQYAIRTLISEAKNNALEISKTIVEKRAK